MNIPLNKQKSIGYLISLLKGPSRKLMSSFDAISAGNFDIDTSDVVKETSDKDYFASYHEMDSLVESKFTCTDDIPMGNNMNENNLFSWENIGELADINSHIAYASTVIEKYQWEPLTQKRLKQQLQQIVDKQNDKMLNISVIGEFATGKSSFINALVGYELLAINAIQGTTVAITIIEYSDSFSITLTDFKGKDSRKVYKSIDTLRKDLYEYTTNPAHANKISYISVTLPSDILKNGFRIIDTPGTNSLELWHEDITRRAINELSDLSIILVDAAKPMPETLSSFVEDSLGGSLKDCAFVANKIDLIREKEREDILKYIAVRVGHNFDIEKPFVVPFSSVALTNTFSRDKVAVDNDSYLLTTDSQRELLAYAARNRVKAQARKVLQLIDNIFNLLKQHINNIADEYENELSMLIRSKHADLRSFVQKQISIRQRCFTDEAKVLKYLEECSCDNKVENSISNINAKIDNITTIDNLSNYIKNGQLSADIKSEGEALTNSVESRYSAIENLYRGEIEAFQSDFKKEFKKLRILAIDIETKPRRVDIRMMSHSANTGQVTTIITEELSKENWAFGGGAAAGAAIGTAFVPGIGTLLGAAIGFFAGAAAAPDINDVREKIKSKLSIPLMSYYRAIASDVISNCNTYIYDLNVSLETEINRYLDKYNNTIQGRIRMWEEQKQKISAKIKSTQDEIDRIQSRQQSIRNIISKF